MPGCNLPDCSFTVRSRFLRPFFTISRGDATLERCHTSYLYGYYSFFQTPLPPFSVVLIGPFSDPPSSSFGFAARKERTAISQQPCRQLAKVLCVRFPPLSQASLLHRPLLPLFPDSHSLPGGRGSPVGLCTNSAAASDHRLHFARGFSHELRPLLLLLSRHLLLILLQGRVH